jgi:hypothetical protein
MTSEEKLVYQVFVLLDIHYVDKARPQFTMNHSIKDKITTELSQDKLETTMRKVHKTSANCILANFDIVYRESINKQTQVGTE